MDLYELARRKKVLLMAHRGVAGGNIPCNSLQAFRIALNQGADIVELDAERSADGALFVQHPGMEKVHLGLEDSIRWHPAREVEQLRRLNCDLTPTEWPIASLEEAEKITKDAGLDVSPAAGKMYRQHRQILGKSGGDRKAGA